MRTAIRPRLHAVLSAIAVSLSVSACGGIGERTFIEEYEPLFCQGYGLCATEEMLRTVNVQECLQFLRQQDYPEPPDCTYDATAAEQCIDALLSSGCVDNDPEIPEVCERVYSGCRIPRVPPEAGNQQ